MLRSITNTSMKLERSNAASYKKVLRLAPLRRKKALFDRNNIRHHGGAAAAFRGQQQQVGLPCERLEEDKFCGGHRGYKSCLCSPSEMIRSLAVEWSCALRQNENNSERAPGRIV